jgi:flagellar protein FlaG
MGIESITKISSSNVQYTEDLRQTRDKQPTRNQENTLTENVVSETPSETLKGLSDNAEKIKSLPDNLADQVKQANQLAKSLNRSLHFFIHEDSGRLAINVVDNITQEVVRTIPPEQFLDLSAKLTKIAGLFFDRLV